MQLIKRPKVRYRLIELGGMHPGWGLLCEAWTGGRWQREALILDIPCDHVQALRLAQVCTAVQVTPDQALETTSLLSE